MNKLKPIFGALGLIVILVAGGYYILNNLRSNTASNQAKYASAYEAHALSTPFNLLSKTWDGKAWTYSYNVTEPSSAAFKDVQAQLSGGGYQVIQKQPDTSDTVYRDLITGDITVTAKITNTSATQAGVIVTVTGIDKR